MPTDTKISLYFDTNCISSIPHTEVEASFTISPVGKSKQMHPSVDNSGKEYQITGYFYTNDSQAYRKSMSDHILAKAVKMNGKQSV